MRLCDFLSYPDAVNLFNESFYVVSFQEEGIEDAGDVVGYKTNVIVRFDESSYNLGQSFEKVNRTLKQLEVPFSIKAIDKKGDKMVITLS